MQPLVNSAPSAHARLGTTLSGKWRLDRVLGAGGVATVFLATHRNQSKAALKLLHPEQALNPIVRDRFVYEGYTANSIDHPGVVKVIDDDISEDGLPFLVMELLEGETLEDRATRHGDRLPASDVLALMDQLLEVLAVAHDKRVIHRDLKPDNLFLTRDGRLKVLDFGIARLTEGLLNRDVTAVGTLMGTPSFMPPEQARSRWDDVDATSDLYSVGATMFTLLTGRLLREAETITEQLALAIHEPAPALASIDSTIDAGVCRLVDRALAYHKRDRFADARVMLAEVRRLREGVPPPRTTSVVPALEIERRSSISSSPNAVTLIESGLRSDGAALAYQPKPITVAIGRRIGVALAVGLLLALALALWRTLGSLPTDATTPPRASSAPSPRPTAASAPAEANDERGSTASTPDSPPPLPADPVLAPAASVAGSPARPTRVGSRSLKRAGSPVAAPTSAAPPPPPPPAKRAFDDPFSKRY